MIDLRAVRNQEKGPARGLKKATGRGQGQGVVVIYARGPAGNTLWEYCVRRSWEENVHVVTALDELIRSLRAGKVAVVWPPG